MRALGELKARELDKDTKFGGLSIAPMNLREFLAGIGVTLPAMADEHPRQVRAEHPPGRQPQRPESQASAGLDDTAFSGRFGIADFARQSLRASSKGDKLDLDRYLPAKGKQAQDAASATRKAEVDATVASPPRATRRYRKNRPGRPGATRRCCPSRPCVSSTWTRGAELRPADRREAADRRRQPELRGQGGVISLDDMRGGLYNGRRQGPTSMYARTAPC